MKIVYTPIPDVLILEPKVFGDRRGYFSESFNRRVFSESTGLAAPDFVQDNESMSTRGVARGLHFQLPPFAQTKLVRCVVGSVVDIVVDLRRNSPTYGHHVAACLSADNHRQLFIPKGLAHGFIVTSAEALFQYKCDEYYHPEAEAGISMLDPMLGIEWPIPLSDAIFSDKDLNRPLLTDFDTPF